MHRLAQVGQQLKAATGDNKCSAADGAAAAADRQLGWSGGGVELIDYGHSYIQGPESPGVRNAIRFWVESRTTLYDDVAGTSTVFYQCGECKSENTFGTHNLFHRDSYKYLPVYAEDALTVFAAGNLMQPIAPSNGVRDTYEAPDSAFPGHRGAPKSGPGMIADGPAVRGRGSTNDNNPAPVQPPTPGSYRTVQFGKEYLSTHAFGLPTLQLCPAKGYEVALDDFDAVRTATKVGHQLVARTELSDVGTGLRAVIEYPVKTMNLELATRVWQTDTGPVAVPDLSKRYEPAIACVSLGFVAVNNRQLDRADFVVEQLMKLPGGGGAEVLHYCNPVSLPAVNTLWALPPPTY